MPERPAAKRQENKIAVALAAREAMREHRKGKPIAFQTSTRPPRPGARNLRESDYAE